jgi:hypothetical protein
MERKNSRELKRRKSYFEVFFNKREKSASAARLARIPPLARSSLAKSAKNSVHEAESGDGDGFIKVLLFFHLNLVQN